jgi:hypothetical protein
LTACEEEQCAGQPENEKKPVKEGFAGFKEEETGHS